MAHLSPASLRSYFREVGFSSLLW